MNDETIRDIIEWCDRLSAEGIIVSIRWNGGGDEGSLQVFPNGPIADMLADLFYQNIELYFNGDQYDTGEAHYDPDKKTFIGMKRLTWHASDEHEIRIPKSLPFDALTIHINGDNKVDEIIFLRGTDEFEPLDSPEHRSMAVVIAEDVKSHLTMAVEELVDQTIEFENGLFYREYFIEDNENLVYPLHFFIENLSLIPVEVDLLQLLHGES